MLIGSKIDHTHLGVVFSYSTISNIDRSSGM